jgi:hypothetical protein
VRQQLEEAFRRLQAENEHLKDENAHLWSAVQETESRQREMTEKMQKVFQVMYDMYQGMRGGGGGGGGGGTAAITGGRRTAITNIEVATPSGVDGDDATPGVIDVPKDSVVTRRTGSGGGGGGGGGGLVLHDSPEFAEALKEIVQGLSRPNTRRSSRQIRDAGVEPVAPVMALDVTPGDGESA